MSGRPRSSDASYYRHCPYCATLLSQDEIEGRRRPRCPRCGFVQWRNPVTGVAGVLFEDAFVSRFGEEALRGIPDTGGEPWSAGASRPPGPQRGVERPGHRPGRRVLLVRRKAAPVGSWCIPCGYVEFDEEIREALAREMREETGIDVEPAGILAVLSNFHDPNSQSVGVWFEARPIGGTLQAGDDADAVGFFDPAAINIRLAFPTDAQVLRDLAQKPTRV